MFFFSNSKVLNETKRNQTAVITPNLDDIAINFSQNVQPGGKLESNYIYSPKIVGLFFEIVISSQEARNLIFFSFTF